MSEFYMQIAESELKIILEALIEREGRMAKICDTSDDEDEIAEVGNDLISVRLLLNTLKEGILSTQNRSAIASIPT